MPRQSAEARAAAAYRAGSAPPPPPKHISREAAVVWREIVASKPPDWFDPGAQILLESFCEETVHARALSKKLNALRKRNAWEEMKPYEKRLHYATNVLTTLSTKLRLSVQALVARQSRRILERGQGAPDDGDDRLLGGRAVWGDSAKIN